MSQNRHEIACNHLTDKYLAPVPSQFMVLPRAMERALACENGLHGEPLFSVRGYCRALSEDCIRLTCGGMDAPL